MAKILLLLSGTGCLDSAIDQNESVINCMWHCQLYLVSNGVEYTYGTPMSVLPSFAERKRVWVFRRCTLSVKCT